MSKYSIILPVRNGGGYVKECVHSILAQTLQDFNLLVLDNKSTDGSPEWIQSLNDSRIQIYPSGTSLGIAENWGRIVSVPKNQFMTLIGHDDLLDPHYLATMDALIAKHPDASLYQAHFRYIDGKGNIRRRCLPMDEKQYGHEFLACQLKATLDSTGTGYMMRSSDYDRLGGIPAYPNLMYGDYELWVKLTLISYKATALEECFSYREHVSTSILTNGEVYQKAFLRYMEFLYKLSASDKLVREEVERYGLEYMYKICESLSHRLLKTKKENRQTSVKQFIAHCEDMAAKLLPGQSFTPMAVPRIKLAVQIDATAAGRAAFLTA
ncbi:MAG: glycosyltransferase, partial [Bacteroidetes bacterium]|nr:glycosyltransferase [Bacteroidota bacterium]